MPRSEAMRRAQNKYDSANRMMLGARVTKADGERFRAICEASGQSVNAALVEYVRACLKRGSLAAAPASAGADGGAAPAAEIVQAAQPGQVLDGAALESAKVAAAAAGEDLPAFLARAVRQVAQTDARARLISSAHDANHPSPGRPIKADAPRQAPAGGIDWAEKTEHLWALREAAQARAGIKNSEQPAPEALGPEQPNEKVPEGPA